ncbi:coiled-coil domain-containing protein 15 [Sinocyclocheilus grahami]|uniref:coiled-coil domain-containing protein 15 n=1 Tax=Sinocyclocheilus grahami TaxID=75366 RepID=UPI0007ACD914|nr:PREDICTED: coiled-coil domain-containing protein 15 [Sinocyclocheilus grahami]
MNQAKTAKERVCSSITQKKLLKEYKRVTSGSRRKAKDVRVLAERNPAVAPVGVWVESADESQEHPAVNSKDPTAVNTQKRTEDIVKVYEPDPTVSFTTDYRASQVLWPHENQEELKRQRQSQFLMYRRHFMDIEREQVKEHQRHRKHLNRTARIKNEKEQLRKAEEKEMERQRQQEEERKDMAEREYLILERLRLEEEEAAEKVQRREKTKRNKESKRYIEAMQALMKEKLEKDKTELPPLCCCGDSFWDSHPDTCANNCIFYKNPKAYAQALQSVLLSCDLKEGGVGHYSSTWKASSMDVHFQRK